jgi:hypothetical protein
LRDDGACVGIEEPRMTFEKFLVPFLRILPYGQNTGTK